MTGARSGLIGVLAPLAVATVAIAGVLVMTGTMRPFLAPPLSAEVHLSAFPLPKGFGLEPKVVSDYLVGEMRERAASDVAMRLTLGPDAQNKLHDIIIPRLLTTSIITSMIRNVPPLADVLSVGNYHAFAQVTLTNRGRGPLADVAMILPGAMRAESGGDTVRVRDTGPGLASLELGQLNPGETRDVTVWLDHAPAPGSAEEHEIAIGAKGGVNGRVYVYGGTRWRGADLEVLPWGRWLVLAILVAVFLGGLALASVTAAFRFQHWQANRA